MLPLDRRFEFRGTEVAWGTLGEGEPTILVHGWPWSAQEWRRIAHSLADRRQFYFFDMIGTGQSGKHEGQDVTPQVQNDLLAALIEHWDIERPHVVGHDFGGLAALRGMFVNGLDYASLTLIDAVAVLPSGSPFFSHVRENEPAFRGIPAYAHKALLEAYIESAFGRPVEHGVMDLYTRPWLGEEGQGAFYRQIAQSNLAAIEELEPLFTTPGCETRLIWGAEDTFIPPERGRDLARRLGVAEPQLIPNAGHMILEDAPERIVAALA